MNLIPEPRIKKNRKVAKRFHAGFERTKPVKSIVVHGTAGGGTLHWVENAPENSRRARLYRKGIALFHFLIERDGSITCLVDPRNWVYHASIGHLDHGTIGIEMLNPTRDNSGNYTPDQYSALVTLCAKLMKDNPQISEILSHRRCQQKFSGKGRKFFKNCPGSGFDWSEFRAKLSTFGFDFQYKDGIESCWSVKLLA